MNQASIQGLQKMRDTTGDPYVFTLGCDVKIALWPMHVRTEDISGFHSLFVRYVNYINTRQQHSVSGATVIT